MGQISQIDEATVHLYVYPYIRPVDSVSDSNSTERYTLCVYLDAYALWINVYNR